MGRGHDPEGRDAVSDVPRWIIFFDSLMGARSFAGPYLDDEERLRADTGRLSAAGHHDVTVIRSPEVGGCLPELPLDCALTCDEIRDAPRLLVLPAPWAVVGRAFPSAWIDVTSADGKVFRGVVESVDIVSRTLTVEL